jgi:hypothetical protein
MAGPTPAREDPLYLYRRALGMIGVAAFAISCLCLTVPAVAQEECEATVDAQLESTEEGSEVTEFQFRVDVRVDNDCAKVEYDLVIEELLPNGQTKKVRKPEFAKLNDGGFSALVEHRMSSDLELRDYRAKIVRCQVCTIMP